MVTPPVGALALLAANPTCEKAPEVGTIYNDGVLLKAAGVELDEIVQGTVVSEVSIENVMFEAVLDQPGAPFPI